MSSIDTLISNATSRANSYASATDVLVTELRGFLLDKGTSLYLPGSIDANGNYVSGLDLSHVALPTYIKPAKDATAMPVYEPPKAKLPVTPDLASINAVAIPAARLEPTLDFSGLFKQIAPSTNLPDFNEAAPDLNIDVLIAQMNAIAQPVLQSIDIPKLTPLNIGTAPTLNIPVFNPPTPPDALRDPVDYSAQMEAKYRQMLPEMQAFIDDKMLSWVGQYAPEYEVWNTAMQSKVTNALDGEVLPDRYEAAMITRARSRVERDFDAVEQGVLESYAKRGFMEPPGAVVSSMLLGRLKSAEALANMSTDIYIKKTDVEVQHLQFVMNLASAQIQSTRSAAIQYAGVVGDTMQLSVTFASELSDKLAKVFEHLVARSNVSIAVLNVLSTQYEVQLKASLSALEGYKLQLEAEKAKKDVEIAQIQFVEGAIKVQELQIQNYTALIEAVSRKVPLEELKLKGYETRAQIFKTTTDAKVAGFEVYKAALSGDKLKMDAEMTKLTVFEDLIKIDQLNLDTQVKAIEATKDHNDALVEIFKAGGEVYKLDADAALQKFTAYADVKKLAMTVYSTELNNAIDSYKANLEVPVIMLNAAIKQYELSVQTAIEEAKLDINRMTLAEDASKAAVQAYEHMASSALGSLNTMASSAISAAA